MRMKSSSPDVPISSVLQDLTRKYNAEKNPPSPYSWFLVLVTLDDRMLEMPRSKILMLAMLPFFLFHSRNQIPGFNCHGWESPFEGKVFMIGLDWIQSETKARCLSRLVKERTNKIID